MKINLLFLALLTIGCLDLSALQSERCTDYFPCRSDQVCFQGECISKPIVNTDMKMQDLQTPIADMTMVDIGTTEDCFKNNFPDYQPNWYPNNLPMKKCIDTYENCMTKCGGSRVYEYKCLSNINLRIYNNNTNSQLVYTSIINYSTSVTIYETITKNGNNILCERGSNPYCNPTEYNNIFWCDFVN